MFNYLSHTDKIRANMLKEINLETVDDLFCQINPDIRIKKLNLHDGMSEQEVRKELSQIAAKNKNCENFISFLGGGIYQRYVPACIQTVIERSEFITAYTPYQPEVSQGTLQTIFDYQTLICNLTGMDVSNASVYDGATACAEAVLMAVRFTKKSAILVSEALNPEYKQVLETYCYGANIKINYLPLKNGKTQLENLVNPDDYACVLIQNPNYFGCVEADCSQRLEDGQSPSVMPFNASNQAIAKSKAKLIVCIDPVSTAILKPPSEYGADVVVGDFQSLGINMNFGGPHGGFMACKEAYVRQLPGRIAGLTKDHDGREAFTLTLQTREQHIRREKATSNICTNNSLMALAATVYLSVLGSQGLKEAANISIQRAHYMAEKLSQISGISLVFSEFLHEFVIKLDNISSEEFIKKFAEKNIFIGIDLADKFENLQNCVLICVTEMNSVEDIEKAVEEIKNILNSYELSR